MRRIAPVTRAAPPVLAMSNEHRTSRPPRQFADVKAGVGGILSKRLKFVARRFGARHFKSLALRQAMQAVAGTTHSTNFLPKPYSIIKITWNPTVEFLQND